MKNQENYAGEYNRLSSQFVTIETEGGLKSQNVMSKMGCGKGAVTYCDQLNNQGGGE